MKLPITLKPFDWAAFILSLAIFIAFTLFGWKQGGNITYLLIESQDGSALYALSEDRTVTVKGPVGESIIQISEGEASFIYSDCADELCVQSGAISGPGEWAACLPNRVIISTRGGESEVLDAHVF
ncbi:MAG: NusG domain II-containing protein [Spirochaetales bacterium]|nr:NusG domain II-containing protein [Spirochaetales bacterium]